MNALERWHERLILPRRAHRLGALLAAVIPPGRLRVVDVGCGDGAVAARIRELRPELEVHGIEIRARERTLAPMELYDGGNLPLETSEFHVALLVDVLHHADDPSRLLTEAARVAGRAVVIKDHLREGLFCGARLRFMDRVGNRRFGVPLPFHYWTRSEWRDALVELRLRADEWNESLRLYPWPLRPIFDWGLHFIARCVAGGAA